MTRHVLLLVRRSVKHAVVAHCAEYQVSNMPARLRPVRLVRVTPDTGPVPEVGDLCGMQFSNRAALRRAILERMKEVSRGNDNQTQAAQDAH